MQEKERIFFRELETTFQTPGWARLTVGWKEELDAIPLNAFWNAKTMEDLEAARIRYELLTSLVDLPEHHDRARLEIIRNESDGEADSV